MRHSFTRHWWIYIIAAVLSLVNAARASAQATPSLRLAGEQDGTLTIPEPSAKFERTFRVEASPGQSLAGLKVRLSQLVDDKKRAWPVQCVLEGNPCDTALVPQHPDWAELRIEARLPELGVYKAPIEFVDSSRLIRTVNLHIERALAPFTVASLGLETGQGTRWPCPECGWAELWVVLQETAGNAISIDEVMLIGFAAKGENTTRFQANYELSLTGEDGKALDFPLDLGPTAKRKVGITIEDIDAAGEYIGTLRWGGAGTVPIDTSFVVVVKEPWLVAFVFILLGVWVATWIRTYYSTVKPRLLSERDLLRLQQRLEGQTPASDHLGEVCAALRERIDEAIETLALGDTIAGPYLTALRAQDALYRRLALVDTWLVQLHPDSQKKFGNVMKQVRAAVLEPPDTTKIEAAATALSDIDDALRSAVQEDAKQRLDEFAQIVAARAANAKDHERDALAGMQKLVAEATDKWTRGEHALARARYDQARRAYVAIVVAGLREAIKSAAPIEMSLEAWAHLQERVRNALAQVEPVLGDASAAIKASRDAARIYTEALIAGLRDLVKRRYTPGAAGDAAKPEQAKLAEVAIALDTAQECLRRGDIEGAQKHYEDARSIYAQTLTGAVLGGEHPPGQLVEPATLTMPGGVAKLPAARLHGTKRGRTARAVARLIRRSEWNMNLSLAIIAALSGVHILWAPDSTWGGWDDWFVALLWGLGVHVIGDSAFEGIMGIRSRIVGESEQ